MGDQLNSRVAAHQPPRLYHSNAKARFVAGAVWCVPLAALLFFGLVAAVAAVPNAGDALFGRGMTPTLFRIAPIALLIPPAVMIIASGGIDLSIASVASLTGVIMAKLAESMGPIPAAFAALLFALFIGALNGMFAGALRVPAVLVTLGMSFICLGLSHLISDYQAIFIELPAAFREVSDGVTIAAAFCALVGGAVLIHLTPLCRRPDQFSHIWNRCLCAPVPYVLSSGAAGLAGVLISLQLSTAQPNMHLNLTFHVLVAVVMGGTIMGSGFGNLCGAVLAAVAIGVGQIVATLSSFGHWTSLAMIGLTLLPAAGLVVLYDYLFDLIYRLRQPPQTPPEPPSPPANPFPPTGRQEAAP